MNIWFEYVGFKDEFNKIRYWEWIWYELVIYSVKRGKWIGSFEGKVYKKE